LGTDFQTGIWDNCSPANSLLRFGRTRSKRSVRNFFSVGSALWVRVYSNQRMNNSYVGSVLLGLRVGVGVQVRFFLKCYSGECDWQ